MKTVERLLTDKLVAVDQALVGVVGVPLGRLLLGVGQHVDGHPQDVGQAVQFALGQVVAVQRLVSFQELYKIIRIQYSLGDCLISHCNFNLQIHHYQTSEKRLKVAILLMSD